MTWKELKERIEQMSPEEQECVVKLYPRKGIPRPVYLRSTISDIYSDGNDMYSEFYAMNTPGIFDIVLRKNEYYFIC